MQTAMNYLNDESGATAAEYALIIALVAAAIVTSLSFLATAITTKLNGVANTISGA